MEVGYRGIQALDKDDVAVAILLAFLHWTSDVAVFARVGVVDRKWDINACDVSIDQHLETVLIFICTQQQEFGLKQDKKQAQLMHHNGDQAIDDRTYCVRSAFTHPGLWRKLYDCSFVASLHNRQVFLNVP